MHWQGAERRKRSAKGTPSFLKGERIHAHYKVSSARVQFLQELIDYFKNRNTSFSDTFLGSRHRI